MTPQKSAARFLTIEEQLLLEPIRARYEQESQRFTERELAHLRFVRWLYQTGRLLTKETPFAAA